MDSVVVNSDILCDLQYPSSRPLVRYDTKNEVIFKSNFKTLKVEHSQNNYSKLRNNS